jgi:hypothetical protein
VQKEPVSSLVKFSILRLHILLSYIRLVSLCFLDADDRRSIKMNLSGSGSEINSSEINISIKVPKVH